MIYIEDLFKILKKNQINFFTGVPDSVLKNFLSKLETLSSKNHVESFNEGSAISIGIGHYLATKKIPCVYLQNSGLGNTINPLVSLASRDVYSIPILLIIGWRGEIKDTGEQLKDEPQHIQQGEITLKQLEVIDIPNKIISADDNKWKSKISQIIKISQEQSRPVALVCRKNTFEEKSTNQLNHSLINTQNKKSELISRENAIKIIARKS